MMLYIFNILFAIAISAALFSLAKLLSTSYESDREKASPFECGFEPKNSARMPFSLRFFLLAVIFLVFDIAIALLMPLPLALAKMSPGPVLFWAIIILLILLTGTLHEWREGSLDWTT